MRPHPAQGHGLCLQPNGALPSLTTHTHSPGGRQWNKQLDSARTWGKNFLGRSSNRKWHRLPGDLGPGKAGSPLPIPIFCASSLFL